MSHSPCIEHRRLHSQRGDALLEAMIGLVIMGAMALGMAYVLSRGLYAQRFAGTQNMAIAGMREQLNTTAGVSSLCGTGTATVDGQTLAKACTSYTAIQVIPLDASGHSLSISATIPSTAVLTSLSTPSNDTTKARYGGDGVLSFAP